MRGSQVWALILWLHQNKFGARGGIGTRGGPKNVNAVGDDRHDCWDLTEGMAPYRVGCPKRICVANFKSSWDVSPCGDLLSYL